MESPINFFSKNDFILKNEIRHKDWLTSVLKSEQKEIGDIRYLFCSDEALLKINQDYLNHDTFTDIITFDYSEDDLISAEIYISTERVKDNAEDFKVDVDNELKRVMVHGVLHCCGYGDSTENLKAEMRALETEKMKLFHVEQK